MSSRVFTTEDIQLYSRLWLDKENIIIIVIPELGEVRMTLTKAEYIAADISRQVEYGRLVTAKKKHNQESDSQEKHII